MSELDAVTPFQVPQWTGGSWEDLIRDADEVFGADLEEGDNLIGVPFAVVKMTFRPGEFASPKTGEKGTYVSLDAIIGDIFSLNRALRRKRITEDQHQTYDPGEHIIFNEGGTGVYRQAVNYLEARERIQVKSELPAEGAYGESRFDLPPSEWNVTPGTEQRTDELGRPTLGFHVRLVCPRGLRASDYENEYTKSGRTRYFA
jgi:hypothetical protein